MNFWLACFVLIFAAVELFQWFMQLGSWQASGPWLIVGGLALAAASNASHFATSSQQEDLPSTGQTQEDKPPQGTELAPTPLAPTVPPSAPQAQRVGRDGQDSISFKVRSPWK